MLTDLKSRGKNPAGLELQFHIVPVDDVDTWGKPVSSSAAAGDQNVVDGDHTLAASKKFFSIELEVNKNQLDTAYMGAVRGGSKKLTFTGYHSNTSPETAGVLEELETQPCLVLLTTPDGKILQLGQENHGAFLKSSLVIGTDDGGERGHNVTIESYGPIMFYEGTIDTDDAT